jgi:hypothetical protein
MNKIIEFLKSESKNTTGKGNSVKKELLTKSFNEFNNDLGIDGDRSSINSLPEMKAIPEIGKGQVWTSKDQYYDAFGNLMKGNVPHLVLVVSEVKTLADECFVRVQTVSPFTEFYAEDEMLVQDSSIIGFEFIVETWNEQPILVMLLENYIGSIDIDKFIVKDQFPVELNETQRAFRSTEIKNTGYLRQSIQSFIEYDELIDEKSIFINIDNSIHYPQATRGEAEGFSTIQAASYEYMQAAKGGASQDRKTYHFHESIAGIKISFLIIHDGNRYIISSNHSEKIKILDISGNILQQSSYNLYDNLSGGMYFVSIVGIENEFRIRLR